MGANELNVSTILDNHLVRLQLGVILLVYVGESPLLGDDDLLATRELVTGTTESLNDNGGVCVLCSDGKDDLSDVDTCDSAVRLAPSTTHTGLQTICTSATQHLVNTDDVEGVHSDSEMERVLARGLGDIFVCTNTGSFQSLRGDLLVLVRDKMSAVGEVINAGALSAKIENSDLGVGHTTIIAGLGIRLVLAVTVAASRSASHGGRSSKC